MTEFKKLAELNALICEAQAIGLEADAMKVTNMGRDMRGESPAYIEADFMELAQEIKGITLKFRKLEGVK
ncbi:MAG: hypothetical protein WC364_15220 [Eubacteriales bacterium]|jgi:hypothetical protein